MRIISHDRALQERAITRDHPVVTPLDFAVIVVERIIGESRCWDCQSGGLEPLSLPISIQGLDILWLESDSRAGCFVSIKYGIAD